MTDSNPSLTRWMALDVGAKNIGVAVTDPLKITVRPVTTITRQNLDADAEQILRVAREQNVEKLIFGLPKKLGGGRSSTLEVIEPLAKRIQEISSIQVEWFDERLSTKEAEELMAEAGLNIPERRKKRNEFAAAVILKRYLEESQ